MNGACSRLNVAERVGEEKRPWWFDDDDG
jgi:hypothetical protein